MTSSMTIDSTVQVTCMLWHHGVVHPWVLLTEETVDVEVVAYVIRDCDGMRF